MKRRILISLLLFLVVPRQFVASEHPQKSTVCSQECLEATVATVAGMGLCAAFGASACVLFPQYPILAASGGVVVYGVVVPSTLWVVEKYQESKRQESQLYNQLKEMCNHVALQTMEKAVSENDVARLESLLKRGCDPNGENRGHHGIIPWRSMSRRPLELAIKLGHVKIVQELLKHPCIKVNNIYPSLGALSTVIDDIWFGSESVESKLAIAKLLIADERVDLDPQYLGRSIRFKKTALINALLERKDLDLFARDCYEKRAVDIAYEKKDEHLTKVLEERMNQQQIQTISEFCCLHSYPKDIENLVIAFTPRIQGKKITYVGLP